MAVNEFEELVTRFESIAGRFASSTDLAERRKLIASSREVSQEARLLMRKRQTKLLQRPNGTADLGPLTALH
jgi:hypothetical protein